MFPSAAGVLTGAHAIQARRIPDALRRQADRAAAVPGTPTEHPPPSTGNIVVGENVWVGARSVLLSGADIGEGAVIGAGTVVDFPVPPFAIVAGNPARVVGDCRERR